MAKFQVQKAAREKIYVKIALMSPSGGGKTFSSLRLATGMAEEIENETGKKAKILMANTEGSRGRYYANEFDYDIVDVDPPHTPETYIELIEFAIDSGYDILIIDSSSMEWEGKGGCLDIHKASGGTAQAWSKVTPRHNAFIDCISQSKIHIIATMRAKDQYEIEKDDKGKTSVKKLGVGARQRDGFEYEFTCTFLLDQATNTATPQKDNTHIFDGEVATLLTEGHGKKIIKWANSSNIEPSTSFKPQKAILEESNTENSDDTDLNVIFENIKETISALNKLGVKREEISSTIKSVCGYANYLRVEDYKIANKVNYELKKIGGLNNGK